MLLVEEVEKFKNIIECKTSDKVSNSNKIEAWNKVTFQLNAKGPIQQARSMEQLKAKYENLKTKARKCAAENRGYYRGTGGGPTNEPDWDPVVEAVLKVINEKTVIGFHNPNDSDAVYNPVEGINMENIEVINQDQCEEFIVLMEDDKDNAVSQQQKIFSSKLDVPPVTNIDNSSTQNADIQTLPVDWSRYTPKQLRTPKIRNSPTMPISSSLQLAKEEYYKKKTVLLREEIELKKMEGEDAKETTEGGGGT
ncbi:hypothetical protein JTB14_020556 [Gonioctena quinquepunctata]|nr:hypothetical protein JTB14_020556 [Gonioctena quinquepunctata]